MWYLVFCTIYSLGAFTPGLFPRREKARSKNAKLARTVAQAVLARRKLPTSSIQRKMFRTMRRKVSGAHAIDWLRNGPIPGQPAPSWFLMWFLRRRFEQVGLSEEQQDRLSGLISFELSWWRSRGWLRARSFDQLTRCPIPGDFDARQRLLAMA